MDTIYLTWSGPRVSGLSLVCMNASCAHACLFERCCFVKLLSAFVSLGGVVLDPGTVRSFGRSGEVCGASPLITVLCLMNAGAGRFLVKMSASMSSVGQSMSLTTPSATRSRRA